jgi:homoserine dehydrogenase
VVTSTPATNRDVRIAILGCGHVGSALVGILTQRSDALAVQAGARLVIGGIAVSDLSRPRADDVDTALLTDDAASLVTDPSIDVVVELMGGLEPAGALIRDALAAGKPVITANKALLASPTGVELRHLADRQGVDLLYEAAVAGAIPLVRALRESLTGERIQRVMGIVNGTTNFILTQMSELGADYGAVLAEAQILGLAERDPTADVEGHDAAAKAAILAGVAFGYDVSMDEVMCEGISKIGAADVEFARRSGYVIKLLAVVERAEGDALSVRVHPALVPDDHPLAGVRDSFNAVFIEGEAAGELMLYGRGAGGLPTASAVVGDVIDATRNLLAHTSAPTPDRQPARLLDPSDLVTRYYLSVTVADQAGVLAEVAAVFGAHGVSIRSMEQVGDVGDARLLFLTHAAREGDVQATLADLAALEPVLSVSGLLRMVGEAS